MKGSVSLQPRARQTISPFLPQSQLSLVIRQINTMCSLMRYREKHCFFCNVFEKINNFNLISHQLNMKDALQRNEVKFSNGKVVKVIKTKILIQLLENWADMTS